MTTSFTFVQDTTPCVDKGLKNASGSTGYRAEQTTWQPSMGSFLLFKTQNKTKHLPGLQSMERELRDLLPRLPEVLFLS